MIRRLGLNVLDPSKGKPWRIYLALLAVLVPAIAVLSWDHISALITSGINEPRLAPSRKVECSPKDRVTSPPSLGQECAKFPEPKVRVSGRDLPLDECLVWEKQCDQPLWDWFCREMGYSKAGGGEYIQQPETYNFQDKRFCEASGHVCAAPTYITCLR